MASSSGGAQGKQPSSACVCSDNEQIVKMLHELEREHVRKNPASKFRFTISKAIRSIAAAPTAVKSDKEAMKLPGIGAFLGGKIDGFLRKNGLVPTSSTNEPAPADVAGQLSKEEEASLLEDLDGLHFSQSSVGSALAPTPPRSRTAGSARVRAGGGGGGGRRKRKEPKTRPAEDAAQRTLTAMVMTPRKTVVPQRRGRENVPSKSFQGVDVVILSDDDDERHKGTATPKPAVKVGHKRKIPATPVAPLFSSVTDPELLAASRAPPPQERSAGVLPTESSAQSAADRLRAVFRRPDDFDVVLLLDNRERENDLVQTMLLESGVLCEVRQLALGDALWIARRKAPATGWGALLKGQYAGEKNEYVLRYVIERKTSRDLAQSIMDGRYTEQKLRLSRSEDLDHPIYLVENSLTHQDAMDTAALRTALASTQLITGLSVVCTRSVDDTIAFLQRMHRRICHGFQAFLREVRSVRQDSWEHTQQCPLPLRPVSFDEYSKDCKKLTDFSVQQVFGRQLRQINGFSAAKAEAVLAVFPTPFSLAAFCAEHREDEVLSRLQALSVEGQERPLGPSLGKALYKLFEPGGVRGL